MSKLPPYEERDRQWDDMPLPDADAAWQKMNDLLDKEERKRPLVPPFFLNCAGVGLAVALLVAGGWWAFGPDSDSKGPAGPAPVSATQRTPATATGTATATPNGTAPADAAEGGKSSTPSRGTGLAPTATATDASASDNTGAQVQTPPASDPTLPGNSDRAHGSTGSAATATTGTPAATRRATPQGTRKTAAQDRTTTVATRTGIRISTEGTAARKGTQGATGKKSDSNPGKDIAATGRNSSRPNKVPLKDRVVVTPGNDGTTTERNAATSPAAGITTSETPTAPATAVRSPKDTTTTTTQNPQNPQHPKAPDTLTATPPAPPKKATASKPLILSAGLGIQQLLAVDGQQSAPYNYQGRSGFLSDHVPSVYLRAEKGRWFVQGEAKLSAPQLFRSFAYSQKTVYDTAAAQVHVTRNSLRKAYYHQFPVTVNYRAWKGWSVGAGAMYSVFYRALSEQVISTSDARVGASASAVATRRMPIPSYRDSFLMKSQWHLLLQTDYEWRRWSLGLRYKWDLQPFIRFTRPDGTVEDQRNEALEAVLRFRLWRSKRR